VTHGGGIIGYESADGAALYYAKADEPGLWRMNLNGEDRVPQRVLDDLPTLGDWENWGLFDTGAALVLRDQEGPIIMLYDIASGTLESVTRVPNIAVPSLSVSSDGLSILYARVDGRTSDLMLVEDFR
jgi:hypothetical protein